MLISMRKGLMSCILFASIASGAPCQHPNGVLKRHVAFVGCGSDGQMGPLSAPKSVLTPVVPVRLVRRLAYYATEDGIGVLAPRGWRCFGVYGSSGSGLVVAPQALHSADFFGSHKLRMKRNAVELFSSYGGTSGRWAVAQAIARYFPEYRSFIQSAFVDLDPGPLPSRPYAHDTFSRRTRNLVRYTTPARRSGEGTKWVLSPSAVPVQGLAMLFGDHDEPNLLEVNARLPQSDQDLAATIFEYAELEAVVAK